MNNKEAVIKQYQQTWVLIIKEGEHEWTEKHADDMQDCIEECIRQGVNFKVDFTGGIK